MKKIIICVVVVFLISPVRSQDIPLKITLPPPAKDANQQFEVLHVSNFEKGKFAVVYTQALGGSVARSEEFVPDTGGMVYLDKKLKQPIQNSAGSLLIVKQVLDVSGKVLSDQFWLYAQRKMDQPGEYKLYFQKNVGHPMIKHATVIKQSIMNLTKPEGMSDEEYKSLVTLTKKMVPEVDINVDYRAKTWAEEIQETKKQFKSLRETGVVGKGDLPRGEKVLTRYGVRSDLNFVVTKTEGNSFYLKFYVTEEFKNFDCLDSAFAEGDVQLTSVATVFNQDAEPAGAFTNLLLKTKDEKGESSEQQYSFVMDADYKITGWKHSVGKNKLNSLAPEVCWYQGDQVMVLSENKEKFFKTYRQVHQFTKGAEARMLYPSTEEEKGSEKFEYLDNFQPQGPVGSAAPLTDRLSLLLISSAGKVTYLLTQSSSMNKTTNLREYASMSIYRVTSEGKVTNIDNLPGYKSQQPVKIERIAKYANTEYLLLHYPVRLQFLVKEEKSQLSPLDTGVEKLITGVNGEFVIRGIDGTVLLQKTAGTGYLMLFYPRSL